MSAGVAILAAMAVVLFLPAVRMLRVALAGFVLAAGALLLIHAQTAPLEAGAGLAGLGGALVLRRTLAWLPG